MLLSYHFLINSLYNQTWISLSKQPKKRYWVSQQSFNKYIQDSVNKKVIFYFLKLFVHCFCFFFVFCISVLMTLDMLVLRVLLFVDSQDSVTVFCNELELLWCLQVL